MAHPNIPTFWGNDARLVENPEHEQCCFNFSSAERQYNYSGQIKFAMSIQMFFTLSFHSAYSSSNSSLFQFAIGS
jgi:hypothetical protein